MNAETFYFALNSGVKVILKKEGNEVEISHRSISGGLEQNQKIDMRGGRLFGP